MLRDSTVNEAIEARLKGTHGETVDVATVNVLKNPEKYAPGMNWKPHSLSPEGVRTLRRALREEDKTAIAWMEKRSGEDHPTNPYGRWTGKGDSCRTENIEYPAERAMNELYWCLSRRAPGAVPFRGLFSLRSTKEDWETRVESWRGRAPDYWSYLAVGK